ncbi:MAG: hypothetical protein MAG795_01069 [Candidatus Woesearchaeota archaeon]|nr:hypothetical protein [Candidatus Woesearchaeota archaeon]
MKITIDTRSDSKEDIQKAINFLSKFIHTSHNQFNSQEELPSQEGMFSMFDSNNNVSSDSDNNKDNENEDFSLSSLQTY